MRPSDATHARPDTERASTGLAFMLRALDHRNYRLFFTGQSISLIGTWMTQIATSWLVYRVTNSALIRCCVGFVGQIPSFLLAPVAGVLVDRWNRHRLLIATQAMAMAQSLALATLTLAGVVKIWHVIALSAFQGVINAFDMPARQAFVVEMVDRREDLSNAIALNSSMVNGARLLGPSLAGAMVAATNEGWCFFVDGVSYIGVIVALLAMTITSCKRQAERIGKVSQQLREGWTYVTGFLPI